MIEKFITKLIALIKEGKEPMTQVTNHKGMILIWCDAEDPESLNDAFAIAKAMGGQEEDPMELIGESYSEEEEI